MLLLAKRHYSTSNSTTTELLIDGEHFCWALEPPSGPMRIPEGTYDLTLEFSPKFQKITPHIQNVPGHSCEEIHQGNFPRDTKGCLLVGFAKDVDFIAYSDLAFESLMRRLTGQQNLTITYTH